MCDDQPTVFLFMLCEIQLVLFYDGSLLVHKIVYIAGGAVFLHRSGHTSDNRVEIEHLHDFAVDHFIHRCFGQKSTPQLIQYRLSKTIGESRQNGRAYRPLFTDSKPFQWLEQFLLRIIV